jgi:hypothetical protein
MGTATLPNQRIDKTDEHPEGARNVGLRNYRPVRNNDRDQETVSV